MGGDMVMRRRLTRAANMAASICGSGDAGPMVANIFALLKIVLVSTICVSGWVLFKKEKARPRELDAYRLRIPRRILRARASLRSGRESRCQLRILRLRSAAQSSD